jgi:hypothetical protein
MFDLFKTPRHDDPRLGELRRTRGWWRGAVAIDGARVPLAVAGPRGGPDARALELARSLPDVLRARRREVAEALYEHYAPYAEAVAAGDEDVAGLECPVIASAGEVWPHVRIAFVAVAPRDGPHTIEVGYRVAWDEEHTLGAGLCEGRAVELNGSVLEP